MMTVFHKTTWANVRAGDTVLMAWASLDRIVEAPVTACEIRISPMSKKSLVFVEYEIDGVRFARTFEPDETAYVQARL